MPGLGNPNHDPSNGEFTSGSSSQVSHDNIGIRPTGRVNAARGPGVGGSRNNRDEAVHAMREAGATHAEIAAKHGVSGARVHQILRDYKPGDAPSGAQPSAAPTASPEHFSQSGVPHDTAPSPQVQQAASPLTSGWEASRDTVPETGADSAKWTAGHITGLASANEGYGSSAQSADGKLTVKASASRNQPGLVKATVSHSGREVVNTGLRDAATAASMVNAGVAEYKAGVGVGAIPQPSWGTSRVITPPAATQVASAAPVTPSSRPSGPGSEPVWDSSRARLADDIKSGFGGGGEGNVDAAIADAHTQTTFGNRWIDRAESLHGISVGLADHIADKVKEWRNANGLGRGGSASVNLTSQQRFAQRANRYLSDRGVRR